MKIGTPRTLTGDETLDDENSKLNLMIKNIIDNYHNNLAQENSTQLIFCDLAVAKRKLDDINIDDEKSQSVEIEENNNEYENINFNDDDDDEDEITYIVNYYDGSQEIFNSDVEYTQFLISHNISIPKVLKDLEEDSNGKFTFVNIKQDNIENIEDDRNKMANKVCKFDAYEDIAIKLMKAGIPKSEIAFIHDYDTKDKKDILTEKMNNGDIRILIGSTAKMGTGLNINKRLVALHNLDYTWTPANFAQRIGRIERQGNMFFERDKNFKPKVYNYATKETFDTKSLQILEAKQNSISLFMNANKNGLTSIEDISNGTINFTEMKALSSGNPLLIEELKIIDLLQKEEAKKRSWNVKNTLILDEKEKLDIEQEKIENKLEAFEKSKNITKEYNSYTLYYHEDTSYHEDENQNLKNNSINLEYTKDFGKSLSEEDIKNKEKIDSAIRIILQNHIKSAYNYYFTELFELKNKDFDKKNIRVFAKFSKDKNYLEFGYKEIILNQNRNRVYYTKDLITASSFRVRADNIFYNRMDTEYILKKINDTIRQMEKLKDLNIKLLEQLKENKQINNELVKNISNEYPNETKLQALRNDKEQIIIEMKNKNFDWIPSYKNVDKENVIEMKSVVEETNNKNENKLDNNSTIVEQFSDENNKVIENDVKQDIKENIDIQTEIDSDDTYIDFGIEKAFIGLTPEIQTKIDNSMPKLERNKKTNV